ncbi:MAG: hypothetical protein WCF33_09500, partial [Pseudonocardiaceae bacterium]
MDVDNVAQRMMRVNEANWDARTPVHVASRFYGIDGSRAPAEWFAPFEWEVEWPEGVSPSGSRRSRREPLGSPGSCHPALAAAVLVRSSHLQ